MLSSLAGNSFLVLTVLVFVAVLLLLESLYVLWRSHKGPQAQKLQKRLHALSATRDRSSQTQLLKQRMLSELPTLERHLQSLPRMRGLDRVILQSGLNWTVSKLLLVSAVLGAVVWLAIVMVAHQSMFVGAVAGALLGAAPLMYLHYRRSRRMAKIEGQLPEALDLMTRALRAGHAFSSTLKMTGEEMTEPIRGGTRRGRRSC